MTLTPGPPWLLVLHVLQAEKKLFASGLVLLEKRHSLVPLSVNTLHRKILVTLTEWVGSVKLTSSLR
jgi:hypothetical protein